MDSSRATVRAVARRAAVLSLMGLGVSMMAPTCGSDVVVPAEDRTPPTARLYALHDTKSFDVPAEGARMRVPPGDRFGVFVDGIDPSGMRRVTISVLRETTCAAGTRDESRREDVTRTERNEVKPGEHGRTQMFLSLPIDARFDCAAGLAPRSMRLRVFGVAENYQGGVTTTPTLIIDVDLALPPWTPPS
jgi:hypothetical protein